jgi:putative copper resistance protein D
MILQETGALIEWPEPIVQLFGFLALFLGAGAVGFRYAALRGALPGGGESPTDTALRLAARRAAILGLVGAVAGLYPLIGRLEGSAARAHIAVPALLTSNVPAAIAVALAVFAIVGFALAASGARAGWPLALVGVVVGALPPLLTGQWSRLVTPVHALAAGLWIGTLFVLLVAGIVPVLRDATLRDERGSIVANLVHRFSPLALTMGMTVVVFGVITAWRHLNPLSSLWNTPYGYALLAKLTFVGAVFALGAWNWKRQRPTLGSDPAALSIRRSASMELGLAGVVLVITALLVSLPSPKPPRAPGNGVQASGRAAGPQ